MRSGRGCGTLSFKTSLCSQRRKFTSVTPQAQPHSGKVWVEQGAVVEVGVVSHVRCLQIPPMDGTASLLLLSQKARRGRGIPIQCLREAEKRWQAGKVEKVNIKFDAEM